MTVNEVLGGLIVLGAVATLAMATRDSKIAEASAE
jgi:hypothetical protein